MGYVNRLYLFIAWVMKKLPLSKNVLELPIHQFMVVFWTLIATLPLNLLLTNSTYFQHSWPCQAYLNPRNLRNYTTHSFCRRQNGPAKIGTQLTSTKWMSRVFQFSQIIPNAISPNSEQCFICILVIWRFELGFWKCS